MKNIKEPIRIEDLVGKHTLSGCDCTTEQVLDYGETHVSAGVIRFILSGTVYEAIEDPEDGYRSSLEGIQMVEDKPVHNTFPEIEVTASHKTKGEYGRDYDVLELRNSDTGILILEVGTDDVGDYYPGCVMRFDLGGLS